MREEIQGIPMGGEVSLGEVQQGLTSGTGNPLGFLGLFCRNSQGANQSFATESLRTMDSSLLQPHLPLSRGCP